MQIYFHSRLCSYLSRVPILVEGTVYIYIFSIYIYIYKYKDAADINMLTNVFFGCLYFIESDTCTTDES